MHNQLEYHVQHNILPSTTIYGNNTDKLRSCYNFDLKFKLYLKFMDSDYIIIIHHNNLSMGVQNCHL